MTIDSLKAFLNGHHHPPLPPTHPAFRPLLKAIAEMIALKGADFGAALVIGTARRFEFIIDNAEDADLVQLGSHYVTIDELAEFVDWLFHRYGELMGRQ
jgi:hypothetical protein